MKTYKIPINLNSFWVLLTLVIVLSVAVSLHTDISPPLPFIIILISIILTGIYGGLIQGTLAGVFASLLFFHMTYHNLGPPEVTGSYFQTAFLSLLYIFVGARLGYMNDVQKRSLHQLAAQKQALRESLQKETAEKDRQAGRLAKSKERLSRAIRLSGIGHFEWSSLTGDCLYCSEQYAAHYGLTPKKFVALTRGHEPQLGLIHQDDRADFQAAIDRLDSGESVVFEFRAVHPNGEIRFIRQINEPVLDRDGRQTKTAGCSLDLTDLREAEARVRQSQRIEAIGTLTGGIAHDFNNLLAIILGNLELARNFETPKKQRQLLESAINATDRGISLTEKLLSFGRRAHLTPTRLNLNQQIQDSVGWSQRILPENISIDNDLMENLWDVELDSTSLDNAIINILLNARDAMPDGGKINIKTANIAVSGDNIPGGLSDMDPDKYVMLAICDNGHGLPPDQLERIFEPFYTNKPVGMGSGLGLSMVEGFIKQSGGYVKVDSTEGVGTTIKLYFKATTGQKKKTLLQKGKFTHSAVEKLDILLAEDEEGVAQVLQEILEHAGHRVTTAITGDQAYNLFTTSSHYDLLVTDVVMLGKLQGPALVKQIRLIQPDLPCVFLSGYTGQSNMHDSDFNSTDIRLKKPVSQTELLAAVSNAVAKDK